jgi:phosphate transport system substrate-binding protein
MINLINCSVQITDSVLVTEIQIFTTMRTSLLCLALALLTLTSCKPSKDKTGSEQTSNIELKGTLKISGAFALGPLMNLWAEKFMVQNPNLKIEVTVNGSGAGIEDLIAGKSNMAMASVNLTPAQEDKGLWKVAVSREGVIPVINSKNPDVETLMKSGIKRSDLVKIFSGKSELNWGTVSNTKTKTSINAYTRSDRSGAAAVWADYLEMTEKDLIGKGMQGDTGIIAAVRKDPYAISFCNAHFAYDPGTFEQTAGIRVLPMDFNNNGSIDKKEDIYETVGKLHRAAYLGTYPSHLCRELSLVCNGKPTDPNVVEFIKWILADGQEIAVKAGYCEIRSCDKDEVLNSLNADK